jgi:hypothetical protein
MNSTGTSRELEGLFVDQSEQAIDGLLKSVLEPLLGLTRDGKIVTKPLFLKLSLPEKILAVMLARLALVRLSVPNAQSEATAEHLQNECLATAKACRECLSRLKSKNILEKNDTGYFLPVWAVTKAVAEIKTHA